MMNAARRQALRRVFPWSQASPSNESFLVIKHSYKIAMTSGQYLRITVSQQPIDALAPLSACQTGLGKAVKGEVMVGLARGLMYAGGPRIVASLWNVDDRATSELMKRFYQGMLGPERLRPA